MEVVKVLPYSTSDADRLLDTPHCSRCLSPEALCRCADPYILPTLLAAVEAAQERRLRRDA